MTRPAGVSRAQMPGRRLCVKRCSTSPGDVPGIRLMTSRKSRKYSTTEPVWAVLIFISNKSHRSDRRTWRRGYDMRELSQ